MTGREWEESVGLGGYGRSWCCAAAVGVAARSKREYSRQRNSRKVDGLIAACEDRGCFLVSVVGGRIALQWKERGAEFVLKGN